MKFAILGCGHIATKMATAVKCLEQKGLGVEAYAVASRTQAKADTFAKEYGFSRAYGSYRELVQDTDVDLIYIATPHSEHYDAALLCINAGKNVLVEKAFCANALQASEVIALAKEKNVFLCEAMWTRFLPAVKTIKDWITAGRIGKVETVEADFSMPLSHIERLHNPALAGGALLDLGIYSLTFADLFLTDPQITGEDNTVVKTGTKSVLFKTGVDASDWINLTYKNGQRAYLKTSMVAPTHNEGTIYGTEGFIKVQNLNDMVELQVYDIAGNLSETCTPPRLANCYEYEVLGCKDALEKGLKECPEMPHAKTMQFMEWMDSLRAAWGVSYPFELSPAQVWDRSGNKSYLQVYDIGSGETRLLKKFDTVIEAPNWSADGKFLTYNSEGRIYKYEIASGAISEVPSYFADNCNNDHVLAPDGSGLYVSHHTKEDGLSRIYKIFFDGRMPELVTPLGPSYLHGITPDGKTLAYCAERNGEYDIYTIPAIGGLEKRLTTAHGLNDGSEFDITGEYIWFNSVRTGRMQAWCMKSDGSGQTQMTFDPHWNTWFPHISPDRHKVVTVAYHEKDVRPGEHVPNKNVEIRLMERKPEAQGTQEQNCTAAWGEPRCILKLFGGQGTINVNSWAPDSRQFAFVSYEA